ncbi:MAG: glycosyltransferase [Oenococcus sp.]|uniref:glycosyltransferase n=1 Tax=Oenococcus TaxID=46254 RepID=UPI0021E855BA|nr:glycosyltransferase [Oenococcus kitaharae]MCV3296564.1 multidrug MFS transporter [Oenococcus kitaharae]
MIFVTVGTHEQPFDRLIKIIDHLVENHVISERVIMQIGYGKYLPKYCTYERFFSYQQIIKNIKEAKIVITHGGPSSFILPLQIGKIPIVVPREKRYGEHVNDHQVEFVSMVEQRKKNLIVARDEKTLIRSIESYGTLVRNLSSRVDMNNSQFNFDIKKIVSELFGEEN